MPLRRISRVSAGRDEEYTMRIIVNIKEIHSYLYCVNSIAVRWIAAPKSLSTNDIFFININMNDIEIIIGINCVNDLILSRVGWGLSSFGVSIFSSF